MYQRLLAGTILAVLSVLPVYSLSAQELDYFSLQPDELLNAEVISASRKSEKVADVPSAVYVITQEDIQRSGVTTIPEALRLAPGVSVAQVDSNSWAVSIRGFNSVLANKILVLMDGRTVYNPLFAGTYWELRDYMLEDIERIEVVRGPGGAIWGANAVNGVINIITKKSKDTQGNLITALYGNQEQGTVSARHGGEFGPENYYRAYAKYFNRDSFKATAGGNSVDDWQGGRSGFRMDWGDRFTLQGDIYRVLTEQLNATPTLTAPFSLIEEETMASQGANLLGRWKDERGAGSLVTIQAYLDYTERDQILLKDQRNIFDIEAQYDFAQQGRHEIIMGSSYRYTRDDLESPPVVTFSPAQRGDNLFSFFAQDKIMLVPDQWFLTLGSKFEHNDYTGFEIQPNARLQFHPDSSQMIWAAVSRAVRTPSRLEHDLNQTLGIFPPATEIILFGNENFDSEKLIAYEAGYRKQITSDWSIDIAAFFNDYDDLGTIGFLPPSAGLFPVETVNGMEGETYGFEIASSWNVTDNFKLTGSYSYLDMFLHVADNNGFNLETAEGLSPRHQANIRASWNITDDVSFDTSAYYVDRLKTNNVASYVRLDLNLGWKINDNVRFNITGQNLLDSSHREFSAPAALNAAEVERSIFGKLTWQF